MEGTCLGREYLPATTVRGDDGSSCPPEPCPWREMTKISLPMNDGWGPAGCKFPAALASALCAPFLFCVWCAVDPLSKSAQCSPREVSILQWCGGRVHVDILPRAGGLLPVLSVEKRQKRKRPLRWAKHLRQFNGSCREASSRLCLFSRV